LLLLVHMNMLCLTETINGEQADPTAGAQSHPTMRIRRWVSIASPLG
jgi:hypothetical protein